MSTYTETDKITETSAEAHGEIQDRLSWLTDEHLGGVLNLVLLEMHDRRITVEFIKDSLSSHANRVLGRLDDADVY